MAVLGIKTAGKKCFSLIDSGKGWLLRQTVHFCFSLTGIILWEIPGHSKTLYKRSLWFLFHTQLVYGISGLWRFAFANCASLKDAKRPDSVEKSAFCFSTVRF